MGKVAVLYERVVPPTLSMVLADLVRESLPTVPQACPVACGSVQCLAVKEGEKG